jgi:hypothetical protein
MLEYSGYFLLVIIAQLAYATWLLISIKYKMGQPG